ncbi:NAD(P)H-dependent oxidoreductase [Jatrophihabitans cynanchi]|uniref:NAD(P)H-dependent oxidoreductase n=1 Tax=Jatrophihabitans cynanchi TaxID=2944128 RepID=A0ABY7JT48_9ACTN|nr:NADPH-dependent FMN reductase [Jatrophihabitans sp. SB3-54]WAX55733.1 NAD(P)H-dependent oxidoreductase [Jatrophihabitans sp. SB3-54]
MRILLISGSTRAASTNSAFVRTAAACAPDGIRAEVYAGLTDLPHFNPDDDGPSLPAPVGELRAAVARSDAVLVCTPEYAGTLPGALKNLLEWLVGGTELTGKPVAWVNVAADERRGGGATATLQVVLGYIQAQLVEDACRHIPVTREAIGDDGLIGDAATRAAIADALAALAHAGRPRLAS